MGDREASAVEKTDDRKLPSGMIAFGSFLFFGATMAALAGTTLIWPGTILDRLWKLNPGAYRQLAAFGGSVGVLFLLLSGAMAVAGIGWFQRRRWGWSMAVVIIATQVLGDVANLFRGDVIQGGIGATVAGAFLLYLLSHNVKRIFAANPATDI